MPTDESNADDKLGSCRPLRCRSWLKPFNLNIVWVVKCGIGLKTLGSTTSQTLTRTDQLEGEICGQKISFPFRWIPMPARDVHASRPGIVIHQPESEMHRTGNQNHLPDFDIHPPGFDIRPASRWISLPAWSCGSCCRCCCCGCSCCLW